MYASLTNDNVGVNEPTLKGENTVREVCLSVSAFVNPLRPVLSLSWLLSLVFLIGLIGLLWQSIPVAN